MITLVLTSKGVNTGFGGSADTRTVAMEQLQGTLIRELHSGILPLQNVNDQVDGRTDKLGLSRSVRHVVPEDTLGHNGCMPASWARASILIRINSLASGLSGVRPVILQSMVELFANDIVPRIPLRGSISASGDLMPLSYIGGTLQGDPAITVWAKDAQDEHFLVTTADVALKESSLTPIILQPKEGLALINGTAVSTGVAALAMHDANCLAVTCQVLTAMSVEALCGAKESFHPIFARCRPHPGQVEAANNIYRFLSGSKLATEDGEHEEGSLRQDRYSIRTASQWIGPVLEDFILADRQVTIECNSVTDNPLIDIEGNGRSFHGGNFQAKAITSAMEKTRSGLQALGQMLFAQCTELINPKMNSGLPPNLAADQPSKSFLMKPVDIMIAALQSELGFLSNSAGSHVQSAEMGNQALNSLALISARYTHTALDVLTQLASAHIFALCQAFDLRAMQVKFLETFKTLLVDITREVLAGILGDPDGLQDLNRILWHDFNVLLDQNASMDSGPRFSHIFRSLQPVILDAVSATPETIFQLRRWTRSCSHKAAEVFESCREDYSTHPDAAPLLGVASSRLYGFIRNELSVPFLRTKDLINLDRGPTPGGQICQSFKDKDTNVANPGHVDGRGYQGRDDPSIQSESDGQELKEPATSRRPGKDDHDGCKSVDDPPSFLETQRAGGEGGANNASVGSYISVLYEAFRSGKLYEPVFACLDEVSMA